MKQLITLCCITVSLAVSSISVNAQQQSQETPGPPRESLPNLERIPIPDRPQLFTSNSNVTREPKVIRKGILAPDANDVTQHQFLLSQKNTGLMRLLPRESSDWGTYPIRTPQGLTGFTFEGVPYLTRLDAVLNHTYLLRSIDYRTSDLLVAFRIVRISDDGALTIAWKILKEFGPPELIPDRRHHD